jgi:hypothetical protein
MFISRFPIACRAWADNTTACLLDAYRSPGSGGGSLSIRDRGERPVGSADGLPKTACAAAPAVVRRRYRTGPGGSSRAENPTQKRTSPNHQQSLTLSRPTTAALPSRREPLFTPLRRPCWWDRRRRRWFSAGCPASLATDPVERVVVVMKDGATREAPLAAVLFDQLARVAAGRKGMVFAIL